MNSCESKVKKKSCHKREDSVNTKWINTVNKLFKEHLPEPKTMRALEERESEREGERREKAEDSRQREIGQAILQYQQGRWGGSQGYERAPTTPAHPTPTVPFPWHTRPLPCLPPTHLSLTFLLPQHTCSLMPPFSPRHPVNCATWRPLYLTPFRFSFLYFVSTCNFSTCCASILPVIPLTHTPLATPCVSLKHRNDIKDSSSRSLFITCSKRFQTQGFTLR